MLGSGKAHSLPCGFSRCGFHLGSNDVAEGGSTRCSNSLQHCPPEAPSTFDSKTLSLCYVCPFLSPHSPHGNFHTKQPPCRATRHRIMALNSLMSGWFAVLQSKAFCWGRKLSGGLNSNVVTDSMYILNKNKNFIKTLQHQWYKIHIKDFRL